MQTIYLGRYGKTGFYKIGQTSQALEKREKGIKEYAIKKGYKSANNYHSICSISLDISRNQALFIESFIRLYFENKGFIITGNDHILHENYTQFKQIDMITLFNNALNKALLIMGMDL